VQGGHAKPGAKVGNIERVLLVPDLHCDDHDERAVALAAQLSEAFKPTRIIFLGDVVDSYWASSFPTDPKLAQGAVLRELSAWRRVRSLFKAPLIQRLPGNHEQRIQRNWGWLSPAFYGMEQDVFRELFIGTDLVAGGFIELAKGKFIVTHGTVVRKWAGWSAKAEMEKWGSSGATGHTHRLATYLQRDHRGVRSWTECGHLSRNPPQYGTPDAPGGSNWQQGVVCVEVEGDRFHVETHPFTLGYRCLFRGRRYQA